jgi:DNA helicase-2/ATP-dependent DNA helicase PcrA
LKYVLKTAAPSRVPFDLDRELNPQQREVATAPPGELLVIAGAGSGKTRTLIYRVALLVARGTPPERILLCTFTNRAAREMVGRVQELCGLDMRRTSAGTFHHVGNRLLRRHAETLGLSGDFSILDPEDARTMLGSIIGELGLARLTAQRFPTPKLLHGLVSFAIGTRRPLADVVAERAPKLVPQLPGMEDVALRFAERKRAMNVCDFDDLLLHWADLLTAPEHAAVGDALREAFDHVLVDEYQDVSALQGLLCDEMARRSGSLTAVGDDAQSIYSFRGADIDQIVDFRRRHPEAKLLRLTINYRSTPQILALANRSIEHNVRQHAKELVAVKREGPWPAVIPLRDVYQQAELVAQRVLELHHDQGLPLSKIAVLYRNHSHSLELQVELSRRGIPFAVRSGVRFFEQAHIKDVVAYLRVRENPRDALSWVRLLRQWPGVGAQTADKIAARAAGLSGDAPPGPPLRVLAAAIEEMRGRGQAALRRVAELWGRLEDLPPGPAGDTIRRVVTEHYGEYAERTFSNAATRREDLEHLATFADHYPSTQAFLDEVALAQGISAEQVGPSAPPEDMLVLTTVHQAKGLEWSACFVLSLAQGRFPSTQALRSEAEIEEERRLFYVAVTRAADELYLLYPTVEEGRDGPSRLMRPSAFLSELDRSPPVFERWDIEEAAPEPV